MSGNESSKAMRSLGKSEARLLSAMEGKAQRIMIGFACLLAVFSLTGCTKKSGGKGNALTNLSIVVWSPFPPATNSYRHLQHLQQLTRQANVIVATNPALFGQSQARGNMAANSPLRALLGIPVSEPAYMVWSQSSTERYITVHSTKTEQRFGRIKVNLATGLIDSVYDVKALFTLNELERRLRQIVGTREEALRLFRTDSATPEQQRAARAVAAALFLPPDAKLEIRMSAPGGTNRGQGHLHVFSPSPTNMFASIASVRYPTDDNLLSTLDLARPGYKFGGLALGPAWVSLNTQGFLLDAEGIPYPKAP